MARAQITIFIIVGVLLLATVALLISLNTHTVMTANNLEPEVTPIRTFIESCLGSVADSGIVYTSLTGGFYHVTKGVQHVILVPYYFNLGTKQVPSKLDIEEEISKYIDAELDACLNNFSVFSGLGYEIVPGERSVETSLGTSIHVSLAFPLSVTRGGSTSTIKDIYYDRDFDFERLYGLIQAFSDEHQKNPNYVPIGYLSLLAHKNNFTYNLDYLDNDVIYSFIFHDLLDNETLLFNFAARYNWSDTITTLSIDAIEPQRAYIGYEFRYQVHAQGDNIEFTDFSSLFDIYKNGSIIFTPTESDVGMHNILIRATDNKSVATQIMQLEVIKENYAPVIDEIDKVTLKPGDIFNEKINAWDPDGDMIMYLVDSALADLRIDVLTGEMEFTPGPDDIGVYTINVIAIDSKSGMSKKSFRMEITDE